MLGPVPACAGWRPRPHDRTATYPDRLPTAMDYVEWGAAGTSAPNPGGKLPWAARRRITKP